jgi:hypothetical protein
MIRQPFCLIAALIILAAAVSCQKQEKLKLPPVNVMIGDEWWGVVTSAYLRLNSAIGGQGEARSTLRMGDLVKIVQIRSFYEADKKIWSDYYFVSSGSNIGWASSEHINIYNYKERAEDARSRLIPHENQMLSVQ